MSKIEKGYMDTNKHQSNLYGDLREEVALAKADLASQEALTTTEASLSVSEEAEELFSLEGGVQIFFVSADGRVSTFSEPAALRIFSLKDSPDEPEKRTAFIQVAGWTHPLVADASPVLEASNGAFMFPDIYADTEGAAVGVVLTDGPDAAAAKDALRATLAKLGALKSLEQLPSDQQLGKLGRGVVRGADLLTRGMEFTTKHAVNLIEYVGAKQRADLPVDMKEPGEMGAAWRYSAQGARYATHATVRVSGFVANRVGKLTKALANYLASKVERPAGAIGSGARSSSLYHLCDLARGGLLAYGAVYDQLESSAKVIGSSVRNETVVVIESKYGESAAKVADDTVTAAGNAALTYLHLQSLGLKGIAKRAAKDTGKAVGRTMLDASVKRQKVEGGPIRSKSD